MTHEEAKQEAERLIDKDGWAPVKGYEDSYVINRNGIVKSIDKWVKTKGGIRLRKGRIIKQFDRWKGRMSVCLSKDSKRVSHLVHRLVMIAFVPNPDNKREVNHINGIAHDNRVENLEWCTRQENQTHAINIGLRDYEKKNNPKVSKAILQYDKNNNFIKEYPSIHEASRQTGFTLSGISRCANGGYYNNKVWISCHSAKGYIWKHKQVKQILEEMQGQ